MKVIKEITGNVSISKKEYLNLRLSDVRLNRLEIGGVDNWEWYGDSLNPEGEDSLEVLEEKIRNEVYEKQNTQEIK